MASWHRPENQEQYNLDEPANRLTRVHRWVSKIAIVMLATSRKEAILTKVIKRTPAGARVPNAMPNRSAATSRAAIIEAAARAFMTRGYAGSSIDMVADELGCTKGPIYYKYKSKADLFFDVQKEAMSMNLEAAEVFAAATGSPLERLQKMVEQQILLIMNQLPFQRVLVQGVEMHLEGNTTPSQREALDNLMQKRDEFEQLFLKVIAEGVQKKTFRQVDPRFFAKMLLGSITWITMWYRPQPGETPAKRKRLAHELTDYVLNGLCMVS